MKLHLGSILTLLLLNSPFLSGLPLDDKPDDSSTVVERSPTALQRRVVNGHVKLRWEHKDRPNAFWGHFGKPNFDDTPYLLPDNQRHDRSAIIAQSNHFAKQAYDYIRNSFPDFKPPSFLVAVVYVPDIGFYFGTKPPMGNFRGEDMISPIAATIAPHWKAASYPRTEIRHLHSEDSALYTLEEFVGKHPSVLARWGARGNQPYRGSSYMAVYGYFNDGPVGIVRPCSLQTPNNPITCYTMLSALGVGSLVTEWT
ncbi:predicted protein [Uncinocarpus reesii 1704]|uniref:Uncharacterized protein n=1 Tax=Uncinocarpus reesii (strain UAMH 1704) TaxID=336963 RepID=C4JW02_UNCRE|nr:uncharacterized protein UREG_06744 [Uncinocarpus reesii 1704]EEP81879.1 predicted protein [Uncinocarpus reesii 1704]